MPELDGLEARGDALIAPSVTRRLIAEFAGRIKHPDPSPRLNALTEREREVMTLVAAGLPTTRSPRGSCLAPPPPRPTSAGS